MTKTKTLLLTFLFILLPVPSAAQGPPQGFGPAVQQFNQGNLQEALGAFEAVTAEAPEFANGWLFLARARAGLEDFQGAHEAFERARTFPAIQAAADYWEGLASGQAGDLDEAFRLLRKARDSGRVNLTGIDLTPQSAALRDDPRYAGLFPSPEEYADPFLEDVRILRDWQGEAVGDQFGWIARNVGDVDGDGIMDAVSSAPTWETNRGRVYVYSSGSGKLLWTAEGEPGDQLGLGVDAAGDMNADGIPDVAAGAPGGARVHVWSGRDGRLLHTFVGEPGTSFGGDVSDAGDLNGDGHDDLIVGASGASGGAGVARVYSGADGSVLWEHTGEEGAGFGSAVGGWGFEGQKLLVVGAPGMGGGVTFVFRGLDHTPAFRIEADPAGTQNGAMFVSVLGDVDGDGVPDVYSSDWAHGTPGSPTGRIYVHSGASGERLYSLSGEAAGDGFGIGVADAGDVDGDGLADLVVGAWQHASQAISGGKIYVYSGDDAQLLYTVTGTVPGETFGFDATGIGDVDGDGITDFLLTSAWSGINGSRSGRTLIVAGKGM